MRLVLCNCPPDKADLIAQTIVSRNLAACVNALPGVRSTYTWKGKVCVEEETTLLIKTRAELMEPLIAAIVEVHPYEVPEVIALPILEAYQPYLDWLIGVTQPPSLPEGE